MIALLIVACGKADEKTETDVSFRNARLIDTYESHIGYIISFDDDYALIYEIERDLTFYFKLSTGKIREYPEENRMLFMSNDCSSSGYITEVSGANNVYIKGKNGITYDVGGGQFYTYKAFNSILQPDGTCVSHPTSLENEYAREIEPVNVTLEMSDYPYTMDFQ